MLRSIFVGAVMIVSLVGCSTETSETSETKSNLEAATESLQQGMDEIAEAGGFLVAEPAELYYKVMSPDLFQCGDVPCGQVEVYSISGCPGGFLVTVSFVDDSGNQAGSTLGISGPAAPMEILQVRFENPDYIGSSYRVSNVSCP